LHERFGHELLGRPVPFPSLTLLSQCTLQNTILSGLCLGGDVVRTLPPFAFQLNTLREDWGNSTEIPGITEKKASLRIEGAGIAGDL